MGPVNGRGPRANHQHRRWVARAAPGKSNHRTGRHCGSAIISARPSEMIVAGREVVAHSVGSGKAKRGTKAKLSLVSGFVTVFLQIVSIRSVMISCG